MVLGGHDADGHPHDLTMVGAQRAEAHAVLGVWIDDGLDALDGGAVDYVLKPVDAARLRTARERVRRSLSPPSDPPSAGPPDPRPLATAKGVVLAEHRAITHARIDGASVVGHTLTGPLFTDLTLPELLRRRPEDIFLRVQRTAEVSLSHLCRLEPLTPGGTSPTSPTGTPSTSRGRRRASFAGGWSIP